MAKTKDSRLAEIFEFQKSKGRGTLGALGSAIGGKVLESIDPRNILFGSARERPKSLVQAIGRGIFGTGYSAGGGRRRRDDYDFRERLDSSLKLEKVERVLSSIDSSMRKANAQLSILAKSTMQQNKMSRDINVIRQNVVLLTKKELGTARTKADMFFMNAKQREAEYERKMKKETEVAPKPEEPKPPVDGKKKPSLLKKALAFAGLYAVVSNLSSIIETLLNSAKAIENLKNNLVNSDFAASLVKLKEDFMNSGFVKSIMGLVQAFKDKDFDKLAEFFTNTFSSVLEQFKTGTKFIKEIINKIPDEKIGEFIKTVGELFMDTVSFMWNTLKRGLSSLSTGDILELAAAGGLYALIFGGKGSAVGGLIGSLISGVFTGLLKGIGGAVTRLIPLLFTPGGAIALAIAGVVAAIGKIISNHKMYEEEEKNDQARMRADKKKRDKVAKETNLQSEFVKKYGQEKGMNEYNALYKGSDPSLFTNPEEQRKAGIRRKLLDEYETASDFRRKEILSELGLYEQFKKTPSSGSSEQGVKAMQDYRASRRKALLGSETPPTKENLPPGKYKMIAGKPVINGQLSEEQKAVQQVGEEMQRGASGASQTSSVQQLTPGSIETDSKGRFNSKDDFIKGMWPLAQAASKSLGGVDPNALLTQWGVESGWGKHVSGDFNYFGIKADSSWKGAKTNAMTNEFIDGNKQRMQQPFRSYGSAEEAVGDYVSFLKQNKRYQKAGVFEAKSTPEYFAALQKAGYATDPNYAKTLTSVAMQTSAQTSGLGSSNIPQLSIASPRFGGDMFNLPSSDKIGELGNAIVNVINNNMQKAEQATSEALSSIDMDSVKDMFNPMIARATYGFTI